MPIIKNQKAKGPQLKQNVAPSNAKDGDVWYENENVDIRIRTTTPAKGIDDGFKAVTYTGNGATNNITGVGFQPDLVWVKSRNNTHSHLISDSINGAGFDLHSNTSGALSYNITECITSFDADGFSCGPSVYCGATTNEYVAWCWKADQETFDDGSVYNNDCSSLSGFTDYDSASGSTTQESFDSESTFKLDSGPIGNYAAQVINIGSFLNDYSCIVDMYHSSISTHANGDYFYISMYRSNGYLSLRFCSDGIFSYSNGSTDQVSSNPIATGGWIEWKIDVKVLSNNECNVFIYANDSLQGTINNTGYIDTGYTDGNLEISSTGATTANQITYVNNITIINVIEKYNEDTGLSIVKYTGDGIAGHEINHSLNIAPSFIIAKQLNDVSEWKVYHKDNGPSGSVVLNNNVALNTSSTIWNNTLPTSTKFTLGPNAYINEYGSSFIAYLFAEKPGFSKFGSYTGNGSLVGPVIELGFQPAFVMIKRTNSAGSWDIFDSQRGGNKIVQADLSTAEITDDHTIEFLNDGFQLTDNSGTINADGGQYIYIAFADTSIAESTDWTKTLNSTPIATSGSNYGFIMGPASIIDRITFPFDSGTSTQIGNLSAAISGGAGFNASHHGFHSGGNSSGRISSIERFEFPFDSGISDTVGNITGTRTSADGCNSSQHGYTIGGDNSSVIISNIDRIEFPFNSGTAVHTGDAFYIVSNGSTFNSSIHGYMCGGGSVGNNIHSFIHRFEFPFDSGTASNVGTLTSQRHVNGGCNSSQHGFTMGGYVPPNVSTHSYIERITFPHDSGIGTIVGNLTGSRYVGAICNSAYYGYHLGGYDFSVGLSTTDRIEFPFDSGTASIVGNLSSNRNSTVGIDGCDFVSTFSTYTSPSRNNP